MGKEQEEGVVEKKTHAFAIGSRIVAAASILFLVPVIRKLRAQQHHKHRRHFPILGFPPWITGFPQSGSVRVPGDGRGRGDV